MRPRLKKQNKTCWYEHRYAYLGHPPYFAGKKKWKEFRCTDDYEPLGEMEKVWGGGGEGDRHYSWLYNMIKVGKLSLSTSRIKLCKCTNLCESIELNLIFLEKYIINYSYCVVIITITKYNQYNFTSRFWKKGVYNEQ